MNFSRTVFIKLAGMALVAAAAAPAAQARDNVYWSVGVDAAPGVSIGVGNARPVYVAPQPVYVAPPVYAQPAYSGNYYPNNDYPNNYYVQPAPVYSAPPVYVRPAPVYYSAPPVYYGPRPYWRGYYGGGHWDHHGGGHGHGHHGR